MRVLVVTNSPAVNGGAEVYLRGLLPRLRTSGAELALLYGNRPGTTEAHLDVSLPGTVPRWTLEGEPPARVLEQVRAWAPDVLFQNGLEDPDVEEQLLGLAPALLFAHDYRGTCISGTKRWGLPTPRPCRRVLGPACLLHYLPFQCGGRSPLTAWRLFRTQTRRLELVRRYQRVVVGSQHMREEYLRHGLSPAQVLSLPFFTEAVPDATLRAASVERGLVLMVGRLTELKGGTLLPEALARASRRLERPLRLCLVGDGPDRPRIEARARGHRIQVHCTGWVGASEREAWMRSAELLAVPSTWPEPFGLVGLEAACVGLPAVAFDVGGVREWCSPGESGELAPGSPPSARGLADAVVRALASPAHHQHLRAGALRTAQRLKPERHVDQLWALLRAAVQAPAARGTGRPSGEGTHPP
ncbi:MAG: glycosyltransferase family 4 protein [Myxococcaceae bacterium]|nr:glycosyltransferase family 4 protein [Myxococcaceae bacterium]MCI0669149.1 glycosyltransferase family 4 protein [Myxococcaceae bacterium]